MSHDEDQADEFALVRCEQRMVGGELLAEERDRTMPLEKHDTDAHLGYASHSTMKLWSKSRSFSTGIVVSVRCKAWNATSASGPHRNASLRRRCVRGAAIDP
jgi:hypothetical protein